MDIDRNRLWCTNLEMLEAADQPTLTGTILNVLSSQGFNGVLVNTSVDGFRLVNEECGWDVGDETLKRMWDLISSDPRLTFGVRFGGDGLMLVFDVSLDELPELAKQLMSSFKATDSLQLHRSLGCSMIPQERTGDRDLWSALFEAADMAHTHAKKRGGNMAIRCVDPLGQKCAEDDFYFKADNFEVLHSGEPSRYVYEPR